MDMDEDDDFYAPEEPEAQTESAPRPAPAATETETEARNEELEEGEEEDEGGDMDEDDDDSDIEIVTERKDGTKAAPPSQSRYSDIRNIPQRSTSNDAPVKAALIKKEEETPKPSISGADLPAVSTSKVDINAIPIHKGTGKPITQISIDEDLAANDKPWRKPGTDLSDYFNYGFDEFTWALYAQKQEALRGEYNQDVVTQNNKKMFEEMANMMMMGGIMPGGGAVAVPGPGPAAAGVAAGMPGMDGMPPEMQAMMQQMMAGGMDPSQMDPTAMSAMFAGMQNAGAAAGQGAQAGQGQTFGAGFGANQGQGYGYDQQQAIGRGNFGGRGRGGRRNW